MAMLLCSREEERRLERARVVRRLPGAGAQRRFPAAALARRPYHLGQRGRRLLRLQSQEGQPDAAGIRHVAGADAVPAERAPFAQERPAVSAELSARKLAGLSLLGFGTRAIALRC